MTSDLGGVEGVRFLYIYIYIYNLVGGKSLKGKRAAAAEIKVRMGREGSSASIHGGTAWLCWYDPSFGALGAGTGSPGCCINIG